MGEFHGPAEGYYLNAIRDRITADIKAHLKERVMAIIEPEIDAAINGAIQQLQPHLNAHKHPWDMGAIVNLVYSTREKPRAFQDPKAKADNGSGGA